MKNYFEISQYWITRCVIGLWCNPTGPATRDLNVVVCFNYSIYILYCTMIFVNLIIIFVCDFITL